MKKILLLLTMAILLSSFATAYSLDGESYTYRYQLNFSLTDSQEDNHYLQPLALNISQFLSSNPKATQIIYNPESDNISVAWEWYHYRDGENFENDTIRFLINISNGTTQEGYFLYTTLDDSVTGKNVSLFEWVDTFEAGDTNGWGGSTDYIEGTVVVNGDYSLKHQGGSSTYYDITPVDDEYIYVGFFNRRKDSTAGGYFNTGEDDANGIIQFGNHESDIYYVGTSDTALYQSWGTSADNIWIPVRHQIDTVTNYNATTYINHTLTSQVNKAITDTQDIRQFWTKWGNAGTTFFIDDIMISKGYEFWLYIQNPVLLNTRFETDAPEGSVDATTEFITPQSENASSQFNLTLNWSATNISDSEAVFVYNNVEYTPSLLGESYGTTGSANYTITITTPISSTNNSGHTFQWFYNVTNTSNIIRRNTTDLQYLTWIYPRITITAVKSYNGASINNFKTNVEGTENTTTTGTVIARTGGLGLYNVGINASGYFVANETINITGLTYDLEFSLYQSIIYFQALEKLSGDQINNFTVSDGIVSDTTTNGTAILYLLSGNNQEVNYTNIAGGFYNTSLILNVTALDVKTVNRSVFSKKLTIYAYDGFDDSIVNTFTVNFSGINVSYSESLSTTDGNLTFNTIEGVTSIIVDSEGYSFHRVNLTVENRTQSYNASLYTLNSVILHFLDQNTRATVMENITVSLISSAFSESYNVSGGHINITNITSGQYEIRFKYETSQLHQSFFTLIHREHNEFDLYMLEINDSTQTKAITLHVSEFGGLPVEDATIQILRGYIIDNQYQFLQVGNAKTNVNGQTVRYFRLDVAPYKFTIEYANETVYTSATSQFITSTDSDLFFTINLFGVDYLERYNVIDGVSTGLTFVETSNTTGYFRYQYTSDSNIKICLEVSKLTSASHSVLDETCSASYGLSGILTYVINHSSGTPSTYFGKGTIFQQGVDFEYSDTTIKKSYGSNKLDFGYMGLIFALLFNIAGFFFGYKIGELKGSLIGLGIAWVIIGFTNLMNTGISISIAFLCLMVVVGMLIKGRK